MPTRTMGPSSEQRVTGEDALVVLDVGTDPSAATAAGLRLDVPEQSSGMPPAEW